MSVARTGIIPTTAVGTFRKQPDKNSHSTSIHIVITHCAKNDTMLLQNDGERFSMTLGGGTTTEYKTILLGAPPIRPGFSLYNERRERDHRCEGCLIDLSRADHHQARLA